MRLSETTGAPYAKWDDEKRYGVVEEVEYVGTVFVGIADDLAADPDQLALDKFLEDDTGVGLDIG